LYNFIVGVSAIPAGLLTGWLWQTWSPQLALVSGAVIALAASAALLLLQQGPPDAPAAGAAA